MVVVILVCKNLEQQTQKMYLHAQQGHVRRCAEHHSQHAQLAQPVRISLQSTGKNMNVLIRTEGI